MTDIKKPKKPSPELLLKWREKMGLAQRDAAIVLGCSQRAILNWEKGRLAAPAYIGLAMNAVANGLPSYGQR